MISISDFTNNMIADVRACKEYAANHWIVATPEERSWIDPYFGWSIDYVMQHLASFATHYLPSIENAIEIALAEGFAPKPTFQSAPELQELFARISYEGLKEMAEREHFKEIDVRIAAEYKGEIEFIAIQDHLIQVLEASKKVDLEKVFIPSMIDPNLNFSLGDCFQFLVRHQILHFAQAEVIMTAYVQQINQPTA